MKLIDRIAGALGYIRATELTQERKSYIRAISSLALLRAHAGDLQRMCDKYLADVVSADERRAAWQEHGLRCWRKSVQMEKRWLTACETAKRERARRKRLQCKPTNGAGE